MSDTDTVRLASVIRTTTPTRVVPKVSWKVYCPYCHVVVDEFTEPAVYALSSRKCSRCKEAFKVDWTRENWRVVYE